MNGHTFLCILLTECDLKNKDIRNQLSLNKFFSLQDGLLNYKMVTVFH